MSSSVHRKEITASEHIIVVGGGFHGLACALEAQKRKRDRQVDIVAQTFLVDSHPLSWTTYLSRCFMGRMKSTYSDLEQRTFDDLLKQCTSNRGVLHKFPLSEYFSAERIDRDKLLTISECEEMAPEDLTPGAKHGWKFTSIAVNPAQLAAQMQYEFAGNGGRLFRGTVRHVKELVEGGIGSFQRAKIGDTTTAPSAIIICVGLGARTIGGIEDDTILPVQMHVVRLRLPTVTEGRAFYDNPSDPPALCIVPLGNGDVILGGVIERGNWYPRPRREKIDELLAKVIELCPDIIPDDVEDRASFTLNNLVVWEGCDTFGIRTQGPRLEVQVLRCQGEGRDIPVVLSYGYGFSELQSYLGLADVCINILEAALGQERSN